MAKEEHLSTCGGGLHMRKAGACSRPQPSEPLLSTRGGAHARMLDNPRAF